MKKYIFYIISFTFLFAIISCEEEYTIPLSSTSSFDGDWQVQYDYQPEESGSDKFGVGYVQNLTYNTAADNGTAIWLEDHGNFWDYKVKVPINNSTLTFGGIDTLINQIDGYDIKVLVKNGKIIKNAAIMPSGLTVDSIYYEVWLEDIYDHYEIDANFFIQVGGVRNTGFEEDVR